MKRFVRFAVIVAALVFGLAACDNKYYSNNYYFNDDDVAPDDDDNDDDDNDNDDNDNDDNDNNDDTTPTDDDTVVNRHWRVENSQTTGQLFAVSGLSPTHVVAVGVGLNPDPDPHHPIPQRLIVQNLANGAWNPLYAPSFYSMRGVWVSPDGSAYAVGAGVGVRQGRGVVLATTDGIDWNTEYDDNVRLWAIFGISATQMWTGGDSGIILQKTEGHWYQREPAAGGYDVFGLWAQPDGSLVLVGFIGFENVFHIGVIGFDGNDWNNYVWQSVSARINGVWGVSSTDIFAVGDIAPETGNASIYHSDGGAWLMMDNDCPGELNAVSGTAGNDVFAVGCDAIMHYDGRAWTWQEIPGGVLACLYGVWADPVSKEVFAVGDQGLILHYAP